MIRNIEMHLRNETVSEMDMHVGVRVPPTATVRDAILQMQQHRTGCVLVCEGTKLLGIFTEKDYLRRVLAKGLDLNTPIRNCMSRNPMTICQSDSIATLVTRIHESGRRRVPVLDAAGNLVGCISVRNLLRHLAEHFPAAVYNLAPASKCFVHEREGA